MDALIKLNELLSNSKDMVLVITDEADIILGVINAEGNWRLLKERIEACISSQDSDYKDLTVIYVADPVDISSYTEIIVHYKCDGDAFKGRYKLVRTLIF